MDNTEPREEYAPFPNAEETATKWAMSLQKVINARLNYWILTESILFAAFGATLNANLGEEKWLIAYVISLAAIGPTLLWHALLVRVRSWYDWYFSRAQAIHKSRHGSPTCKEDTRLVGVYPPERYMKWSEGDGLSLGRGLAWITWLFLVIWLAISGISARMYYDLENWAFGLLIGILILLSLVYLWFIRAQQDAYAKKLSDRRLHSCLQKSEGEVDLTSREGQNRREKMP